MPLARVSSRRRFLFGTCLVISIAIHMTTFLLVIFSNSSQRRETVVDYVDIADVPQSPLPSSPVISKPAQLPVPAETEQPPPRIEPSEALNKTSDSSTSNSSADILSTPLALGMANGYFSTLAEGRSLREDIRGYYFEILEKINERWWQKAGTLKEAARRDGIAEIQIGRDGKLYDVRLTWDTGSKEVDLAIIDVLTDASPFPPLPASYELEIFRAPLRIAAPSHLFRMK